MMTPAQCRGALEKLLAEEAAALTELEPLLQREHELLSVNDIDQLEQAGDARQACVGRLVRMEDERRGLCRMLDKHAGDGSDAQSLERLMAWCDAAGTLTARWKDCADRAQRCREQNERNGMLVAARLRRVEGLLSMLDRNTRDGRTYGPRGGGDIAAQTGRMLTLRA